MTAKLRTATRSYFYREARPRLASGTRIRGEAGGDFAKTWGRILPFPGLRRPLRRTNHWSDRFAHGLPVEADEHAVRSLFSHARLPRWAPTLRLEIVSRTRWYAMAARSMGTRSACQEIGASEATGYESLPPSLSMSP